MGRYFGMDEFKKIFYKKNAKIDPGTNHFTVMDNNGKNQDAKRFVQDKYI
ncbi:MAG: hypothetical protein CM15mP122_5940 [Bacteroidota bacterium]|nr:MAG: hypothetical protein CM15mP122_5940 [Bacteroidota bacterium]